MCTILNDQILFGQKAWGHSLHINDSLPVCSGVVNQIAILSEGLAHSLLLKFFNTALESGRLDGNSEHKSPNTAR